MILALDLARSTGWCAGAPDGSPIYGTFTVDAGTQGQAKRMALHLDTLIKRHGIRFVYFEQPVMGSGPATQNFHKVRYLFGICYLAEAVAEINGCRAYEVPIASWRKHFLGHGGYSRADAKRAALTRCKQLGYRPDTDDCAEAIGIWDYACALHSRVHSWQTSPLAAVSRPPTTGDENAR